MNDDAQIMEEMAVAQNLFDSGQFSNAALKWIELYEKTNLEDEPWFVHITSMVVRSLYYAEQYQSAFAYVMQNPLIFTTNSVEQDARISIDVSLKTGQFIMARQLFENMDVKYPSIKLSTIEKAEEEFRRDNKQTIIANQKALIYLGDGGVKLQEQKFNQSFNLPFEEWMNASKVALLDKNVNQLLRSTLMEIYVRLHVDEKIEYLWIDEKKYSFNPIKSKELITAPKFSKLNRIMDEQTQNIASPDVKHMAFAYLKMFLSAIYPKLSSIKNEEQFVFNIVQKALGEESEIVEDDEVFKKVNEIVNNIMSALS